MATRSSSALLWSCCVFVVIFNAFALVDPEAHCYIQIANGTCYYEPPNGYDCELGNEQDPTFKGLDPCDSTGICYVPLAGDEEVCYYTAPYGYDCYYKLIPELIVNMTHCDLIKANSAPEISFSGTGVRQTDEDVDLLVDYIRIIDRDARENERDNKGYVKVTLTGVNNDVFISFQPNLGTALLPAEKAAVIASLGQPANAGGVEFTGGGDGSTFVNVMEFQARMDPLTDVMKCLIFRPKLNKNGKLRLKVDVNDQGNTGGTEEKDSETLEITVVAINDPPFANMAEPLPGLEDTLRPLTGLVVGDPDVNDELIVANRMIKVDLSVTKGKIYVQVKLAAAGAVQTPLVGNNPAIPAATISLTSTLIDLNNALNTLQYLPNLNENDDTAGGVDHLTIYMDDFGRTGAGGAQHSTKIVTLHVTPVNDAPIIDAPDELVVDEDVSLPGTAFNITISDVDTAAGLTLTMTVLHGTLTQSTTTGTLAQLNTFIKGSSYLGNANFNGYDTLTVTVNDGSPGGITVETIRIRVEAVNDPPSIWPDCPSLCVGGGYTGTVIMNNPGVWSVFDGTNNARPKLTLEDPDVGTLDLEILLEATTGVLKLTTGTTSALRFVVPQTYNAATGHDVMWIMGSRTALNAALASLRYEGTNGVTSNIVIAVNDQQHTGKGRAETDYFELPIP